MDPLTVGFGIAAVGGLILQGIGLWGEAQREEDLAKQRAKDAEREAVWRNLQADQIEAQGKRQEELFKEAERQGGAVYGSTAAERGLGTASTLSSLETYHADMLKEYMDMRQSYALKVRLTREGAAANMEQAAQLRAGAGAYGSAAWLKFGGAALGTAAKVAAYMPRIKTDGAESSLGSFWDKAPEPKFQSYVPKEPRLM